MPWNSRSPSKGLGDGYGQIPEGRDRSEMRRRMERRHVSCRAIAQPHGEHDVTARHRDRRHLSRCTFFALVSVQACTALGYVARRLNIDVAEADPNPYPHMVYDVWCNQ